VGRLAGGSTPPPELGQQPFCDYADQWVRDRVLGARTAELYTGLLRNHLLRAFGDLAMGEIDEAAIRRWRKERLDAGPKAKRPFGPVTRAKAYRLLHAIFETASEEVRRRSHHSAQSVPDHRGWSGRVRRARDGSASRHLQDRRSCSGAVSLPRAARYLR